MTHKRSGKKELSDSCKHHTLHAMLIDNRAIDLFFKLWKMAEHLWWHVLQHARVSQLLQHAAVLDFVSFGTLRGISSHRD